MLLSLLHTHIFAQPCGKSSQFSVPTTHDPEVELISPNKLMQPTLQSKEMKLHLHSCWWFKRDDRWASSRVILGIACGMFAYQTGLSQSSRYLWLASLLNCINRLQIPCKSHTVIFFFKGGGINHLYGTLLQYRSPDKHRRLSVR